MLDEQSVTRISQNWTQAFQGYTLAVGALYSSYSSAMFGAWIEGIETVRPGKANDRQPKSWYRHPDAPFQTNGFPSSTNPTAGLPTAFTFLWPWAAPAAQSWPVHAATVWWLNPPSGNPMLSWPAMHMLQSSGVPHPVAKPLAEANTAAMEAMQATSQALTPTDWSNGQSDGFFAAWPTPQSKAQAPSPSPLAAVFELQSANMKFCNAWMNALIGPTRAPSAW